jgi:hypothetical protein
MEQAAKEQGVKAVPFEADHWRRAWLLSIIDAAARAGLTPIGQTLVHRAAFLSNALASVYCVEVENPLVTRWRRGPFFPELQWDLDRLAAMGVARFDRIRHHKEGNGWWFEVRYGLGPRAADFVAAAMNLPSFERAHRFHRELLAAIASLPDADRNEAALGDANYANTVDASRDEEETVIDFGEWTDRNFTERTANALNAEFRGLPDLEPRARIHLYLRYLGSAASRERRFG